MSYDVCGFTLQILIRILFAFYLRMNYSIYLFYDFFVTINGSGKRRTNKLDEPILFFDFGLQNQTKFMKLLVKINAYHSNFIRYKKMDVNNVDYLGVFDLLNEHDFEFSFTKII